MAKTNVIVLNSEEHTSTLAFEHVGSLISFVGHFLDYHNRWDVSCELVLVHRNNQVVRRRFERLGELVDLIQGIHVANWLFTDEGDLPNLNSLEWADDKEISKVFDSKGDESIVDEEDGFNEDPYA